MLRAGPRAFTMKTGSRRAALDTLLGLSHIVLMTEVRGAYSSNDDLGTPLLHGRMRQIVCGRPCRSSLSRLRPAQLLCACVACCLLTTHGMLLLLLLVMCRRRLCK